MTYPEPPGKSTGNACGGRRSRASGFEPSTSGLEMRWSLRKSLSPPYLCAFLGVRNGLHTDRTPAWQPSLARNRVMNDARNDAATRWKPPAPEERRHRLARRARRDKALGAHRTQASGLNGVRLSLHRHAFLEYSAHTAQLRPVVHSPKRESKTAEPAQAVQNNFYGPRDQSRPKPNGPILIAAPHNQRSCARRRLMEATSPIAASRGEESLHRPGQAVRPWLRRFLWIT